MKNKTAKNNIADQIEEFLSNHCPDAVLIGEVNERKNYYPAIIGVDSNNERVIYDRERLIECFVMCNKWSYEDASEWVSYNVDRSLPYSGPNAPIIMESINTFLGA